MRTPMAFAVAVTIAWTIAVAGQTTPPKSQQPKAAQGRSAPPSVSRLPPGRATGPVKELQVTPATIAYGYYDAATPPVMRIQSGDTVRIHTLITSTPQALETAGLPKDQVEPALREIVEKVTNKGPGGHILTGPIFVEGAEPGDVLEVRI